MTKISDHKSSGVIKMILIGDTGAGKTGALAALAAVGYNVRILDLDNGVDVLNDLLTNPKSQYPKGSADRVDVETFTDPMKNVNGKLIPAKSSVWQKSMSLLDKWDTETSKLGNISTWTPNDVLAIDSLTMLGTGAMNFVLAMNGRIGQKPFQSDWYDGQLLVEGFLQKLYDEGVNCNIIVNTHVLYIGPEDGPQRGYPSTGTGSKLAPRVGRYFNTMLMAKSQGSGVALKRKLVTTTTPVIELKSTAPLKIKPEYPLETGLADYFKDVLGKGPNS